MATMHFDDDMPARCCICPEIPQAWCDQLADGGRIIAPVGSVMSQRLVLLERHGQQFQRTGLRDVRFVKLIGEHGWDAG